MAKPFHAGFLSSPGRGGRYRVWAAASALLIVGAGVIATPAPAAADPAPAAVCSPVNPMGAATPTGSTDGYTLFVRENAILANSETEGTLAVGGTAIFGDTRGNQNLQYPIMHGGIGGNADYSVPTIGGAPNRVLIQRFASEGKIVQVKAQGATDANAEAGVKIGDQSSPAGYTFGPMFGGSGTTYFPADGDNMSPQIDSAVQPWSDLVGARESWSIEGDVLSYFPADSGAAVIQSFTKWRTVAPPAGDDQTITLNADGPSRLPLSDFTGISKFKLDGYSETSFLVITVDPSDVVSGRVTLPSYSFAGKASSEKEGISHILFDFSAISGEVEVVAPNEPVRGSIYAPNTHIVFPAESDGGKEFEGQLIAQNLTALQGGKEIHTNLFKGRFACNDEPAADEGTFNLQKILSGVDAGEFPTGTVFPVTATWEGGSKDFELPAEGTVIQAGVNLPEGTVVTLTEGVLPDTPEGYVFVSGSFSTDTITILAGGNADIAWSVTNTYAVQQADLGGFDLSKTLEGTNVSDFPSGTVFTITAKWTINGTEVVREYELPADGSVVAGPRDLPAGTLVTFGEVDVPLLDGYTFNGVDFSTETLTVKAGETPQVVAVNTYEKDALAVTGGTVASGALLTGVLLLLVGGATLLARRRHVVR